MLLRCRVGRLHREYREQCSAGCANQGNGQVAGAACSRATARSPTSTCYCRQYVIGYPTLAGCSSTVLCAGHNRASECQALGSQPTTDNERACPCGGDKLQLQPRHTTRLPQTLFVGSGNACAISHSVAPSPLRPASCQVPPLLPPFPLHPPAHTPAQSTVCCPCVTPSEQCQSRLPPS